MLKQHLLFVLCSVCGTVVKGERSRMRRFIACGGEGSWLWLSLRKYILLLKCYPEEEI